MCTLTVIPLPGDRVRLAFNRDEQRSRPAGLSPRFERFGSRLALFPIDPVSGGTWLAVNDAGLVLALLNANPPDRKSLGQPRRSRGEIIPELAGADSPSSALSAVQGTINYTAFAPFRLVLIGHGLVADVVWDGREPMVMSRLLGHSPVMFTSSGLGDHIVEGVRRELFNELFAGPPETWPTAQDAFHRHRWPGREHLSVNMTRPDARTVSFSTLDITAGQAAFAYHPDGPDAYADRSVLRLALTTGAA